MEWIGSNISYHKDKKYSSVSVSSIPRGVIVLLSDGISTKNRYILDEHLVKHIGPATYYTFYLNVTSNREEYADFDFDDNLLINNYTTEDIKRANYLIDKVRPKDVSYIQLYRHLKCVFAVVNVIISEFEWSLYGDDSAKLSADASNIANYSTKALDYIASKSLPCYHDTVDHIHTMYKSLKHFLEDKKFVFCTGTLPSSCPVPINKCTVVADPGWIALVIFIVLLGLLLLVWFFYASGIFNRR